MHPMFVQLYLEAGADDLQAEEEGRRRAVNRGRRAAARRLRHRPGTGPGQLRRHSAARSMP